MTVFDHLIVGAGSAGCVLARRLAETGASVLLLDAGPGGPEPVGVTGSSFFAAGLEPGRSWPSLLAVRSTGNAARDYVRGRGVGGSSAINAMVAIEGLPDDYDRWGLPGWMWDDLADARERSRIPRTLPEPGEHGPVDRAFVAGALRRSSSRTSRNHRYQMRAIFSTTSNSYHGHPDPLTCPEGRSRRSFALYYYTNGRPAEEIDSENRQHSTLFVGRNTDNDAHLQQSGFRRFMKEVTPPFIVKLARKLR